MHDTLRRKVINVLDQAQRITPLLLNAVIAEIAQMLANNRLFTTHQAEGIFQICAQTKHRRHVVKSWRQRHRIRHVTP